MKYKRLWHSVTYFNGTNLQVYTINVVEHCTKILQ